MDKWEEVKANIKRLEQDPGVNQELLRAMDHISLADYWKRRAEEEREILFNARQHMEEQEHLLHQEKMRGDTLERSHEDKHRLWEKERETFEEKIKVKEVEIQLLRERGEWETKFQDVVKNLGGASRNGIRLTEDGAEEDVNHDLRRLLKEFASLRDTTDEIQKSTHWLDREHDQLLAALNKKSDGAIGPTDIALIKELLMKMTQQVGSFQLDLFKKMEAGVTAVTPVTTTPQAAPKDESLFMAGGSEMDGNALTKMWRERLQSFLLVQEDIAREFCHKARNLLGIISGTAQPGLATKNLSPEIKEAFTTIDQNTTLLLDSIEEFLTLTKYPQLTWETANINHVIQETASGPAVEFHLDQAVPSFSMDKKLIKEVIGYILDNAREASPEGKTITIATKFLQQEKMVELTIEDHGKGVSENHLKKVFRPYFTTKKDRRGLGLSKALHIAILHGGKMTFTSVKDAGAEVHCFFPV